MADDTELVDFQISEKAQHCVARLQEIISEFDLSGPEGAMAVGELFAWVHILGFMSVGRERMLAQMERSAAASIEWAGDQFDAFRARAAIVAALDRGESGGRLQ